MQQALVIRAKQAVRVSTECEFKSAERCCPNVVICNRQLWTRKNTPADAGCGELHMLRVDGVHVARRELQHQPELAIYSRQPWQLKQEANSKS